MAGGLSLPELHTLLFDARVRGYLVVDGIVFVASE
eukprot:CAMPEP_0206448250 /NCGR_PEP_ID=MMETSP0324_2-20121206/17338_1 /ASSEMBLY_ACC=CAM_ASM_000836 /TAXON_ID=2866 /ORGANISM="Crypthecodinium cohnii, Strain Seligo" /LENGTH=34 /DNA_ID= /DNA_START= /DNA_END= /DNA_ORIENTATION=